MGYIDSSLLSNETVIERAKVHWIIYARGVASFIVSLLMFSVNDDGVQALGAILFVVALFLLASAYLTKISTELGVTNKRVIAKIGFISRRTVELNLSKVESLSVNQSIFGRVLDYGVILVNGTGGVSAPFGYICSPLAFRKRVNEQIEKQEADASGKKE